MEIPSAQSFSLAGKTALVTGAGRGLGVALAAALAEAGAEVYLAARSLDETTAVAEALGSAGHRASAIRLDVTRLPDIRMALADGPAFDVLVNNAGTNRPKPLSAVTEEDYDAVFDLNVKGAVFVAQAVATRMLADRRGGSIVNISSQMGHVGAENRTIYCASKHALEGFTKALALELGPQGVRVNTIAPTFIETPMTKPFLRDKEFRTSVLSKIRLGRLGTPADLMGAPVFLASDASAMVTGTSIRIDGGWTAG
ncbi:MAG: glucose 1-dehydrogenase [Roseitalea sp.]|jgi:NAD(P)-dependent dehydrogenase (short-subunit alcohol dehydrogenase family)|nr:glucose 1-dehydrogenase [Roseitalea sp.]MBO6721144.1 glucose 1-dehydrogenase [Roseitalea sp.]MBO6744202.1 glucose 1-dehydrogenase [Roseitalea sp.]